MLSATAIALGSSDRLPTYVLHSGKTVILSSGTQKLNSDEALPAFDDRSDWDQINIWSKLQVRCKRHRQSEGSSWPQGPDHDARIYLSGLSFRI